MFRQYAITDELFEFQDGDDMSVSSGNIMDSDKMDDFIKAFESNLEKKRKPAQKTGIELFSEE